jgi:hypothetical protein
MTYEEFKKDFTDEQIVWLAQHAETPRGTKEQQLASYANQLYDAKMWSSPKDLEHLLNLSAKPKNVYSVKDILSTVAPGQKADSNAVNQFIEDWNSGNIDNQAAGRLSVKYGPGAYRNADKVMKQAYADKKAVKDNEVGTVNQLLGTLFYPRSLEAMKAGKSVGFKNAALDAVEDFVPQRADKAVGISGLVISNKRKRFLGKAQNQHGVVNFLGNAVCTLFAGAAGEGGDD